MVGHEEFNYFQKSPKYNSDKENDANLRSAGTCLVCEYRKFCISKFSIQYFFHFFYIHLQIQLGI